jgi:hypothetical protein
MALLLGCGTKTAPPPVVGGDDDTTQRVGAGARYAPEAKKGMACPPDSVTAAEASAAYARAEELEARVKTGELDRKLSWKDRYELFDRAARGGHREGLARAGRMMFSSMFTSEAPKPEQRLDYVEAITRLLIAARRGNTSAASFMPGMETLMFGKVPEPVEPPLAELPKEWVEEALQAAETWFECQTTEP